MAERVRSRTLAHLERLLSISAVASACSGTGPVTDPGYGVVDPLPPPPRDDPPPDPSTIPEATTPPPVVEPTPPDHGYAVVDPMPPPATCTDFSQSLSVSATGQSVTSFVVRVNPSVRYRGHVTVGDEATVTQGRIEGRGPNTWAVVPDAGIHLVQVTTHGTCEGDPAAARVEVRWEGDLGPDTRFTVNITGTKP